jgi:murein DD-endopeptidase MepM/ murein hydrolase activator NlpD
LSSGGDAHSVRHALLGSGTPAWAVGLQVRRSPKALAWTAALIFSVSAVLSYALISSPDGSGQLVAAAELKGRDPETVEMETGEAAGVQVPGQEGGMGGPLEAPYEPAQSSSGPVPAGTRLDVLTGRVPYGGTIAEALRTHGVSNQMIHEVATAMRPVFDFRHAHPEDFFALIQDDAGELLSFEFRRGRSDIYRVERAADGGLSAHHLQAPLERRVVQLGGVIESSLFESMIELGERSDLVNELADIFAWDFDFSRMTRPGDEFRLVFEKYYDREGFVRYGTILASRYKTATVDMTAIYFEDDEGYGDYFTPEGNSVRRTFLRAPLKYSRISSRYSHSRLHPILKVRRPHHGLDYAAPVGTPVWAVAGGQVTQVGWSGGFGRLVKVRHDNGYVTFYGHLSRFADALRKGDRVEQKQVIGYVGSSGLSTGPHLDYRLNVRGRFVDPLKVNFPTGKPIAVKSRERFLTVRDIRLAELNAARPALILEAAM